MLKIGKQTFSKCISLRHIKLPNKLERIDYLTFSECINLEEVTIPESVTFIDSTAFLSCEKLQQNPHKLKLPKHLIHLKDKLLNPEDSDSDSEIDL